LFICPATLRAWPDRVQCKVYPSGAGRAGRQLCSRRKKPRVPYAVVSGSVYNASRHLCLMLAPALFRDPKGNVSERGDALLLLLPGKLLKPSGSDPFFCPLARELVSIVPLVT
jgi:hypothetical protein